MTSDRQTAGSAQFSATLIILLHWFWQIKTNMKYWVASLIFIQIQAFSDLKSRKGHFIWVKGKTWMYKKFLKFPNQNMGLIWKPLKSRIMSSLVTKLPTSVSNFITKSYFKGITTFILTLHSLILNFALYFTKLMRWKTLDSVVPIVLLKWFIKTEWKLKFCLPFQITTCTW